MARPFSHASWRELLAAPAPGSHLVQIYDNDEFLVRAVGHFAAEGLRRGEVVALTGTAAHVKDIRRALTSLDIDTQAAEQREQLMVVSDAEAAAQAILKDGLPDAELFHDLTTPVIEKAKADARYSGMRWWGELSNIYYRRGDMRAVLLDEDAGDEAVRRHGIALLCTLEYDRFDASGYDTLHGVCCRHSHVIPADDYVRHRLAVNRAVEEVLGRIEGPLLRSLLAWTPPRCDLPSSQALLFWIRENLPDQFERVLSRARELQHA
jgi:hypothetical protein